MLLEWFCSDAANLFLVLLLKGWVCSGFLADDRNLVSTCFLGIVRYHKYVYYRSTNNIHGRSTRTVRY
jgi:hypothetical protein